MRRSALSLQNLQNRKDMSHISIKSQLILFLFIARTASRLSRRLLAAPLSLPRSLSLSLFLRKSISICVANWNGSFASIRAHVHSPANVKRQLISFPSACAGASIAAVAVAHKRRATPLTIVSAISPVVAILRYFYCRECVSVTACNNVPIRYLSWTRA